MSPQDHAEELAKKMAGNHLKFDSFAWRSEPEDSQDWCLVYTHSRDSGLLAQSNAEAIAKELEPFCTAEPDADCRQESHSHWAVGHVDGYAIRVYRNGQVTPAFAKWAEIQATLEAYPSLDDDRYSELEYEASLEAIEQEARFLGLRDDAPEGWPGEAFGWLWEHEQSELESQDDQGAYPSGESVWRALKALGYLKAEDSNNE